MGDTVQTSAMGIFVSSRIVRLTKMRNMLLSKIREVARRGPSVGVSFDYVLLFDGDMFTAGSRGFNPATVHAMLGLKAHHEYDAVCGNQLVSLNTLDPLSASSFFAHVVSSYDCVIRSATACIATFLACASTLSMKAL
jgi:hypothetical protein